MSNLANLLYRILKAYGVPITEHTIKETILTHPEFPSLQCISDALDSWKVKHVVIKLSLEKLRALDVPAFSHLKKNEFVWITCISDLKVHYWSATGNKIETREKFEQQWSGVALAIEDITDAGELDYTQKHQKEITEKIFKYTTVGVGAILFVLLLSYAWGNDTQLIIIPKILLLFINALGLYISYTLIRQEKHQSSRLVDKFCRAGKHVDCNSVTSSRYSRLFGIISWAEMGAVYFCAVMLWVTIASLSPDWLPPLWWLSAMALPFTLWSFITQAFIIRKWCLFCCSVSFLLWINAGIIYVCVPQPAGIYVPIAALMALLLLVCIVAVVNISKTSGSKDRLFAQQRETARIKYDIQTIQAHLAEPRYSMDHIGFVWGNPQSPQSIVLYVSVACSHCGKAVKELRQLTDIYPDFAYRLIFAVYSNKEDESNAIIRHFLSLYKTMNKNEFFDMLDIWYTRQDKKLETVQKEFTVSSVQEDKVDALYKFSQQAKISYTPAILLNGRLLSQLYLYQDLYGIARTLDTEE